MTPQPPSARSATILVVRYFNGSAVSSMCVLLPTLTEFWCSSILQIVKATSRHASTVGKLQDIINLTKDAVMSSYFIEPLCSSQVMRDKLPPFGIKAYSWMGGSRTDRWLQPHTCYLETKFVWNKTGSDGISAAGHIAIIEYYMVVLLASVVDRYFPLFWILILLITAPAESFLTRPEIYLSSRLAKYTGNVTYWTHPPAHRFYNICWLSTTSLPGEPIWYVSLWAKRWDGCHFRFWKPASPGSG